MYSPDISFTSAHMDYCDHALYIVCPSLTFTFFVCSSQKLLNRIWENNVGRNYSTTSTKFVLGTDQKRGAPLAPDICDTPMSQSVCKQFLLPHLLWGYIYWTPKETLQSSLLYYFIKCDYIAFFHLVKIVRDVFEDKCRIWTRCSEAKLS